MVEVSTVVEVPMVVAVVAPARGYQGTSKWTRKGGNALALLKGRREVFQPAHRHASSPQGMATFFRVLHIGTMIYTD